MVFFFLFITFYTNLYSMDPIESAHYKLTRTITAAAPIHCLAVDSSTGKIITAHRDGNIAIRDQYGTTITTIKQNATNLDVDDQNIVVCSYPENSMAILDKATGQVKTTISASYFTELSKIKLNKLTGTIIAWDLEHKNKSSSIKVFNAEGKGMHEFTVQFGNSDTNYFLIDQNDGSIVYHYYKSDTDFEHFVLTTDQQGKTLEKFKVEPYTCGYVGMAVDNQSNLALDGYDKLYLYTKKGTLLSRIDNFYSTRNLVIDQKNNNIIYARDKGSETELKVINEKGNLQDTLLFNDLNNCDYQGYVDIDQKTQNIVTAIGSTLRIFEYKK